MSADKRRRAIPLLHRIYSGGFTMIDPQWLAVARSYLGLREYPGSANNPTIMGWLKKLGWAWLGGDNVAWCGTFMSHCLSRAGVTPPKAGYRALSWATWGVPCSVQVGAIGVKTRKGGGHVFFIVGETKDKRYFLSLGGNQSDSVCIAPILKADVTAIRWPAGQPQLNIPLPVMSAGSTVSEA